jgi:ssDNA-binding Zn-finger/Zn-ribbon topoisomerase 1
VGCSGYPDCRYIKKDPPTRLEIGCPQCGQGEIVEKRTRFGLFYGCDRYPECDFAVSNRPVKEHPCPECGSILLERPKSYRCWNCGAELDKELTVKKHGDPEAEAAARAAKAAARAERAKARSKTAAKRSSAKRPAARKRAAATRRAAADG